DSPSLALQGRLELAARHVPQPHRTDIAPCGAVVTAGPARQRLAVGREGDVVHHHLPSPFEDPLELAAGHVPQPHRPVTKAAILTAPPRCGRQRLAVGREGERGYPLRVPLEGGPQLPARHIPEL